MPTAPLPAQPQPTSSGPVTMTAGHTAPPPVMDVLIECKTPEKTPDIGAPGYQPEDHAEAIPSQGDEKICCRQCMQLITFPEAKISVSGAHRHTFANPAGVVYDIGCFGHAQGCGYVGDESAEFTWFKGYRWRIAVCSRCLVHLGWRFSGSGNHFHGLILDRLQHVVDRRRKRP